MGIGHINKVKVDMCSYPPFILLAEPKFGKTTFWSKLVPKVWGDNTKGLLISCANEEGYHSIQDVQYEVAYAWRGAEDEVTGARSLVDIIDDIVEHNDEYGLKGVCFDTLDTFIDIATKEVLREHKKEKGTPCKSLNDAFGGYGRGKVRLLQICNEQVDRLRSIGVCVWFLCHIKQKEKIDLYSGEKYEQITNNLTNDIFSNFATKAQMTMVGAYQRKINNGKLEEENRVLYYRPQWNIDAGGRFTHVPDTSEFSVDAFLNVFNEAVKYEMGENVSEADVEKARKQEEKEIKKHAAVAKKKIIEEEIDPDRNEELKSQIQAAFSEIDTDKRDAIVAYMKGHDLASFKDVSEVPTAVLEHIVGML